MQLICCRLFIVHLLFADVLLLTAGSSLETPLCEAKVALLIRCAIALEFGNHHHDADGSFIQIFRCAIALEFGNHNHDADGSFIVQMRDRS
jgi:hypothetical protein